MVIPNNACRNCDDWHAYLPTGYGYDVSNICLMNPHCLCNEFIPADNLQYLEQVLKLKEINNA
jgi:hypothetical protein